MSHAAGEVAMLTVGALAAATSFIHPEISTPFVGVSINVVVAACAGAISGIAFSNKDEPRTQMFKIALGCVIMGCALDALVIGIVEWKFKVVVPPNMVSALAVVIAFISRWLLPAIIERVPSWLDKIPFLRKTDKKGD